MRLTYVSGLIIMGISDILIGLSGNVYEVIILYGLAGFGAAFFFSSAGGTLAGINEGKTLLVMGLYNAMFSLGGILGLNWGIFDSLLGFRFSSILLGVLTLLAGIINYFMNYVNFKGDFHVLKNKNVILVASATAGVSGTYYVVSEYFPSFSYYFFHKSSILIGSISSILLLSAFVGSSLTFTMNKLKEKNRIIVSSFLGILPALLLYNYFVLGLIILGLFNEMAISVIYAYVIKEVGNENSSLALAETNSIQIGLGSLELLLPYVSLNYLWYLTSIVSLLPLLILIKVLK